MPSQEQTVEEEVEEEGTSRGWFGFGTPKKQGKEVDNSIEERNIDDTKAGSGKQRIKRKLPLNIPQAKLEGIQHAFTAEALRAIGSDEVDRLAQLLNAGMEGGIRGGTIVAQVNLKNSATESTGRGEG